MARGEVPLLERDGVVLRAHHDRDIARIVEQSTDPASVRWTSVPVPYGIDDAKRFVRDAMPGGWATDQEWGFAVDHGGRYVGTVSLRNAGPRRGEVAFGAHPDGRGTGVMTTAVDLLLEWGFAARSLEAVEWRAEVGNWASRRLAWRLGFSLDGTIRRHLLQRDRLADAWVATLLGDEPRRPRHAWFRPPTLRGETVVLRAPGARDIERVTEACGDETTQYWLGHFPSPYTRADAEEYLTLTQIDAMARADAVHWAVTAPDDDTLLGMVSLVRMTSLAGPEVGYWAHPAARGHGITSAAVRVAVDHAFTATAASGLGLASLRLVAATDNAASRRVAERADFTQVGIQRLGAACRDGRHDAAIYQRVAADGTD